MQRVWYGVGLRRQGQPERRPDEQPDRDAADRPTGDVETDVGPDGGQIAGPGQDGAGGDRGKNERDRADRVERGGDRRRTDDREYRHEHGADHEVAVRERQHPGQSVDEGEPGADQAVDRTDREPGQDRLQRDGHPNGSGEDDTLGRGSSGVVPGVAPGRTTATSQ